MKSMLAVLVALLPFLASGQSTDVIRFKRIKIGILYSPDYCYRLLSYQSPNKWVQDLRDKEEIGSYGYTTGLSMRIDLTDKIILETGLLYSIKGEQTKNTGLQWATPDPDFPVTSKTRFQFKYIDVPLKVNYGLGGKTLRYFVSAGVSFNIFSEKQTRVISEFNDGHKSSENSTIDLGYLKFNVAAIFGFGVKYDLTKRICISAEPVYRQFLNSIVVDEKAKEYPYSIGVNMGACYSFKKKNKAGR